MELKKELFSLLSRLNPRIFDAFPPQWDGIGHLNGDTHQAALRMNIGNYQSQGNVMGTDMSGELSLLAKLTWKMKYVDYVVQQQLSYIVNQYNHSHVRNDKAAMEQQDSLISYINVLADEYCGTTWPKRFLTWPPKPNWLDKLDLGMEERALIAVRFYQASEVLADTPLEQSLYTAAEKLIEKPLKPVNEMAEMNLS